MKIKKVKYFTFLLVSFLMTKIFCNSPIEMSENNYSFELQNEKIIKVFILDSSLNNSKELKFYEQKNNDSLVFIGTAETICLEDGQFGEGFQDIYYEDDYIVIQQSFGDGNKLIISKLYLKYEKRNKIKLKKYTEQHIDRFSDEKDFTEIEYNIPKNIYLNDISSDFVYDLHKSNNQ